MQKLTEGCWQARLQRCSDCGQGLHYSFLDGGEEKKESDIGILLLHPLALHSGWISQMITLFAKQGFKVWALDLPCHGKSRKQRVRVRGFARIFRSGKLSWAANFTLQEVVADVLGFARHIKETSKIQYLVLMGLSFGGVVAGYTAAQDKFGCINVLVAQCYAAKQKDIRAYENTPKMIGVTKVFAKIFRAAPVIFFIKMSTPLRRFLSHPIFLLQEIRWVFLKWWKDPDTILMFSKKALRSLHYAKSLDDPRIPTFLLVPTKDGIFAPYAAKLAKRLPRAIRLSIYGGYHSVFVDGSQDEYKAEIVRRVSALIRQNV